MRELLGDFVISLFGSLECLAHDVGSGAQLWFVATLSQGRLVKKNGDGGEC